MSYDGILDQKPGPIPPELADFAELAKAHKRTEVDGATTMKGGDPDLEPHVEFYRDGRHIAGVGCRAIMRDALLQAIHIGVPGYAADVVQCYIETLAVNQDWFARHHREPDPGEMQRLFERGNPGGLIHEALWLIRGTRAGRFQSCQMHYELDRKTRELRWGECIVGDSDQTGAILRGGVIGSIRGAFAKPVGDPAEEGVSFEDYGLTPEQARTQMDVAITRVLSYAGFMVALAAPDDYTLDAIRHAASTSKGMQSLVLNTETGEEEHLPAAEEETFFDHLAGGLQDKFERERKTIHRKEQEVAHHNRAQRCAEARGRKRG